ncbi:hypothetical protein BpHYR1_027557 [Brachionus plicatilis]|uniref:Uncharacterized protein n=1 Tax=Brachionus plicatilis TaxID=10195 RepID=A0A3M7SNH4_BRAPC|nr:hypothetical protein BpHYR1_027557 [Brachionus plicatilis]
MRGRPKNSQSALLFQPKNHKTVLNLNVCNSMKKNSVSNIKLVYLILKGYVTKKNFNRLSLIVRIRLSAEVNDLNNLILSINNFKNISKI